MTVQAADGRVAKSGSDLLWPGVTTMLVLLGQPIDLQGQHAYDGTEPSDYYHPGIPLKPTVPRVDRGCGREPCDSPKHTPRCPRSSASTRKRVGGRARHMPEGDQRQVYTFRTRNTRNSEIGCIHRNEHQAPEQYCNVRLAVYI
jgi:hypothetical protein